MRDTAPWPVSPEVYWVVPKNYQVTWEFVIPVVDVLLRRHIVKQFDVMYAEERGYRVHVTSRGGDDYFSSYHDSQVLAWADALVAILDTLPEDQRKAVLA